MDSLNSAIAISPQRPSNRPLRVLYYIAYYQRMAGANRSLFELITHLPDTVTPLVVVAGEGLAAEAYRQAGIEVEVLPPGTELNQFGKVMLHWSLWKRAWVTATELLPYTSQCLTLLRAWQPDLVHVNDGRGSLMIGPAARLGGYPVVGHMRGQRPFTGIAQTIFETLSDRIVTVCSAIQSDLSPGAQRKAITIYNGIRRVMPPAPPVPWLTALRARGVLIVSCFASVVPFKGHHHLLDAIAELNRRGWGDRVAVFCIGDLNANPDHVRWLMARQQTLGVQNVTFTGWQSDPFAFYQATDIEVLPSVSQETLDYGDRTVEVTGNEGFPRTHLEAMAFGLPIVGTDIAGVHEQVSDGVNGFVVPPGDAIALANALETLLSDAELRSRMGEAGRDRVQRDFSSAAHVAAMVDLYQEMLSDRPRSRPVAATSRPSTAAG